MPVEFKDYYTTLGVARDATPEAIKKAFRKLARLYHPDIAKDKKTAEAKFKEINEAYEVLSDPANRKKYDELGPNWQQGPGFPPPPPQRGYGNGSRRGYADEVEFGDTGFSQFFEQFFGRGGNFGTGRGPFQTAPEQAARGADLETEILVTLTEALEGTSRTLSLQHTNPRTGESEKRTIRVRIPAGVREGQAIRVPAQGGQAEGAPAGDLFLHVRFAAHPDFRVKDSDLYHELELAPWEAVLGTTVTLETLQGAVRLRIPPGTNPGLQLRVRGQGLPVGQTGTRGDIFAVVKITIPEELTPEERALWEQLSKVSTFNPRA